MEIVTLSTRDEWLALKADWERLWALQPRPEVFQIFAWLDAFIESFTPSLSLRILTARMDGMMIGILPLISTEKPGHWTLAGSPNADYQDFLAESAFAVEIMRAFVNEFASLRFRVVVFEELAEQSLLLKTLRQMSGNIVIRKSSTCHFAITTDETVASIRRKGGIKDNERRLAKIGAVEMCVVQTVSERIEMLDVLFEQHRARWASSQFKAPEFCEFYRRLCRSGGLARQVHFSILRVGKRIVACHLGFIINGRFIYYKPTYDVAVKGAGQVLLSRLFVEAQRLGLEEMDFTRGGEPYKAALASGVRQNFEARLFLSVGDRLRHRFAVALRAWMPRDANGLALTTKWMRCLKSILQMRARPESGKEWDTP